VGPGDALISAVRRPPGRRHALIAPVSPTRIVFALTNPETVRASRICEGVASGADQKHPGGYETAAGNPAAPTCGEPSALLEPSA